MEVVANIQRSKYMRSLTEDRPRTVTEQDYMTAGKTSLQLKENPVAPLENTSACDSHQCFEKQMQFYHGEIEIPLTTMHTC